MFIHGGKTKGAGKREFRFQGVRKQVLPGRQAGWKEVCAGADAAEKTGNMFLFQWLTYMHTGDLNCDADVNGSGQDENREGAYNLQLNTDTVSESALVIM